VQISKVLLEACHRPSKGELIGNGVQVMKELSDRLMDTDDKVRSAAVVAVCCTAISYPQVTLDFMTSC